MPLWSDGMICNLCRVVTNRIDLDLVVEVTEVGVRSQTNSSKILVCEVSLYSYKVMVWYGNGIEWELQRLQSYDGIVYKMIRNSWKVVVFKRQLKLELAWKLKEVIQRSMLNSFKILMWRRLVCKFTTKHDTSNLGTFIAFTRCCKVWRMDGCCLIHRSPNL